MTLHTVCDMSTNESTQWRKFLQPLVTGLVALMAAATLYLQRQDSDDTESRIRAVEVEVVELKERSNGYGMDIDKVKQTLSDIRSDVSFIRGKLENVK